MIGTTRELTVRYLYYRDRGNRPRITVCHISNNGEDWGRGMAICSLKDNPCKKTGRKIARDRAFAALRGKELPVEGNSPVCALDATNIPYSYRFFRSVAVSNEQYQESSV